MDALGVVGNSRKSDTRIFLFKADHFSWGTSVNRAAGLEVAVPEHVLLLFFKNRLLSGRNKCYVCNAFYLL